MKILTSLYRTITGFLRALRANRQLRHDLHAAANGTQPIRMIVGSSYLRQEGWVHSDVQVLDVTREADWRVYFQPSTISAIMAEHVWEHLTADQALQGARNCLTFLKPGGYFRIAVPDGLFPDPEYIERVKVGADDHQVLYTYKTLSQVLEQAGFEVTLLEYFDENGTLHAQDWDAGMGVIRRSKRHDPRNQGEKLGYTSIIIDAIKPTV